MADDEMPCRSGVLRGNDAEVAIAELRGCGLRVGAREVEHRDASAIRCHQAGGGEAQTILSSAAGDDCNLVFEQHLDCLQ